MPMLTDKFRSGWEWFAVPDTVTPRAFLSETAVERSPASFLPRLPPRGKKFIRRVPAISFLLLLLSSRRLLGREEGTRLDRAKTRRGLKNDGGILKI